jgi:1-acyl-sn-glycerol-3-phosphate acyltransferase
MLRYYWTFIVAGVLLLIIGIPIILVGHLLRSLFGIEDFVFPFAKFGAKIYLRAAGARVHLSGLEHLDRNKAYLFVANHQSNLDPPLMFSYLGHNTGAIAKKELLKVPLFKQGFPLAHIVPIDRTDRESAIESTRRGAHQLRQGHSLMAFPEGTRSLDGQVKEFKKGVFYMAVEAGVEIAPVVINGTRLVMPKNPHVCRPGDVYLKVLPPVNAQEYEAVNIEELIERVRSLIIREVEKDLKHETNEK